MNILFLNHNVVWQSTFNRCFLFARELVILGHQVTIMTNAPRARLRFWTYSKHGVIIIESPDLFWGSLRTGWDPVNVVRRCFVLRHLSFDCIHAFDTRPTVILPALYYKMFMRRIPLIIDWADWWGHGGAISLRKHKFLTWLFAPIETFFEEYFRRFADATTVTSMLLAQRAVKLGLHRRSVTILYSGADIRAVKGLQKQALRKKLSLPSDAHIIIFPAYVQYDLPMVLQTFEAVIHRDTRAILVLTGKVLQTSLVSYGRLLQSGKIILAENLTREMLFQYLVAADVGLLPLANNIANAARFPIKFGDFLAAGLPCITNNVGDVGMLVKKYNIGLLTRYDHDDMARNISKLLKQPNRLFQLHKRILLFAQKKFSWQIFAYQLFIMYRRVCRR
ncbi:glycosyltransferase [Candidatus Gottesmanbacteria bacterium]|nr:glycosyltransferase [Candidatus Gottesmanbacteria bacterium]